MNHTLTLALAITVLMLTLFCGCNNSTPPEVISYRDCSYVRLDVIQKAGGKEGLTFYLEPIEEGK